MLDGMAFGWLTVFLDFPADAFGVGVAFWREVTGYRLSPSRGAAGEFATLLPPSGDAYLRVQRLLDGGGRCHLDLHVDTASEPLAEAAGRAVALGARVRRRDAGGVRARVLVLGGADRVGTAARRGAGVQLPETAGRDAGPAVVPATR